MALPKGTRVQAKLIEEVEKDHWIVSFQGNLIQVKNSTSLKFTSGLFLNLEVVKEYPLELKVISKVTAHKSRLDVIV